MARSRDVPRIKLNGRGGSLFSPSFPPEKTALSVFLFFILAFIFFKVINAHSLTSQIFLKDFPFHSLEKPFPIPLTAPFSIYSISPKNMLTKLIVILHF